jgi:GcrA cell cycle regulator
MTGPASSWTEERVALARRLWDKGFSAGQIASELGCGLSRNAVIGKIHRSGDFARRVARTSKPEGQAPEKLQRARASALSSSTFNRGRVAPPIVPAAPALAVAAVPPEVAAGPGIGLFDLTNETCRWPMWGYCEAPTLFCGAPRADLAGGMPYCPGHARAAYTPAFYRRRDVPYHRLDPRENR